MTELKDQRSPNVKVFDLGNRQYKLSITKRPRHYLAEDGTLKDIDLTPQLKDGNLTVDMVPYVLRIDPETPSYRYTSQHNLAIEATLLEADGVAIKPSPAIVSQNKLLYKDIAPDLDCELTATPAGIIAFVVLKSDLAPKTFTWEVKGERTLMEPVRGHDANGQNLKLQEVWAGDRLTIEWGGELQPVWRRNRAKPISYPVRIDPTVNEDIVAGADDAFSAVGGPFFTQYNNKLYGGRFDNGDLQIGLRFQTVAIPAGSTIDSAEIALNVNDTTGPDSHLTLAAVADDDLAAFSASNRMADATAAANAVDFTATNTTPITVTGLGAAVQNVIDRTGWTSGNDLGFVIRTRDAGATSEISVEDFSDAGTAEASLEIVYTAAAAGGPLPGKGLTESVLISPRALVR